ncbi:MAG: hypothetical protein L0Z50_31400, partial [Verrucomicrobiales bacterium]|nr:hypothetical protein [Verrucomicrobiales bacterium]
MNWRIWFRASTSSPTKFISLSSNPTSTRIVLSEAPGLRVSAESTLAGVSCWAAMRVGTGALDPGGAAAGAATDTNAASGAEETARGGAVTAGTGAGATAEQRSARIAARGGGQ